MHGTPECKAIICGMVSPVLRYFMSFCFPAFPWERLFHHIHQLSGQGINGSFKHRGKLTKGTVISPWLFSAHPSVRPSLSLEFGRIGMSNQLICITVMRGRPVSRPPQSTSLLHLPPSSIAGPQVAWPVQMSMRCKIPGKVSPRNPWGPCWLHCHS